MDHCPNSSSYTKESECSEWRGYLNIVWDGMGWAVFRHSTEKAFHSLADTVNYDIFLPFPYPSLFLYLTDFPHLLAFNLCFFHFFFLHTKKSSNPKHKIEVSSHTTEYTL